MSSMHLQMDMLKSGNALNMNYEKLLDDAPDHMSDEFLEYLKRFNRIVWENDQWLVIENFKYHDAQSPWYTAFHKPKAKGDRFYTNASTEWWDDIDILDSEFRNKGFDLLIKATDRQSVRRAHIHLIRNGYERIEKQ